MIEEMSRLDTVKAAEEPCQFFPDELPGRR